MTSIPRTAHSYPTANTAGLSGSIGQKICLVAGLTCLAGFLVDMLVLGTPIEPFAIEWRIRFLEQLGDRSIVLFFAVALLFYSLYGQYRLKRALAFASLVIGVAFLMSCTFVIRDSLIVKDQTIQNISTQEKQVRTQIEATQDSEKFSSQVTPEMLQQASQQLSIQSDTLKDNARKGITKAGMASVGNLMVVGIGLLGIGRLGFVRSK